MARRPRPVLTDVPQHIVQRGNNRGTCFFEDGHRLYYLGLLGDAARACEVTLHAYVLMTNHVHLLATPHHPAGISAMMQTVGRRYVPWINQRRNRTGGLYDGRFKAGVVRSESHALCCYRYIELNPVRAGLASDPADYPWSSYRSNALGEPNNLVSLHPVLLALGETAEQRGRRYRAFVAEGVSDRERDAIRAQLSGRRGRPKKGSDPFSR